MRSFLERKLQDVFDDFKSTVDGHRFCNLKSLRFDAGNIPQYSDISIQQLYLLRYLAGYTVEYYIMYKAVLNSSFLNMPLEILSIGCGCGLDLYGAFFAAKAAGLDPNANIQYTGIDRIDWGRYQDRLGLQNVDFFTLDINSLGSLPKSSYNILMFPKSIGEFDDLTFERFKGAINRTTFSRNKVCIVSSVRNSSIDFDSGRISDLAEIMKGLGFNFLNGTVATYKLSEPTYIKDYMGGLFFYPREALNYVGSLNRQCQCFLTNGRNCEPDCQELIRLPMLRTEITRINYLQFQRY